MEKVLHAYYLEYMKCYVIYEGDHSDRPIAYEDNLNNAYEWAISNGYNDLEIENGVKISSDYMK